MMTPQKWDVLCSAQLNLTTGLIKRRVATEARLYLTTLAPGIEISTNELVEALYPRAIADQSLAGDTARTMIYKMIGLLAAEGLQDCCRKGEVQGMFMGRPKRPWLWFCPEDTEVCCMCGQILPKEDEI